MEIEAIGDEKTKRPKSLRLIPNSFEDQCILDGIINGIIRGREFTICDDYGTIISQFKFGNCNKEETT